MQISIFNNSTGEKKSIDVDLKVGMCATMYVGSDRYGMVITEVISQKKIRVTHINDDDYDHIKIADNLLEFIPNEYMKNYVIVNEDRTSIVPDGDVFTFRKNNRWIKEGCGLHETGGIRIGQADPYLDPNF